MRYPEHLLTLIALFKKLPGVGSRTAERFAFHILDWPHEKLENFGQEIKETKQKLKTCEECGGLIDHQSCPFCNLQKRQGNILCIVASAKDIFLIEETGEYRGFYHVIGGLLSPIQGMSPSKLCMDKLKKRIVDLNIQEVIIALDSTLEGDATSLYIKKELERMPLLISRLALGLPMGSSLDFIDGGTLGRALAGRRNY